MAKKEEKETAIWFNLNGGGFSAQPGNSHVDGRRHLVFKVVGHSDNLGLILKDSIKNLFFTQCIFRCLVDHFGVMLLSGAIYFRK